MIQMIIEVLAKVLFEMELSRFSLETRNRFKIVVNDDSQG